MAVIEDALQTKIRDRLQFQNVALRDVVPAIGEIRSSIFGMKKGEQNATRPQYPADPFDHGLYQRLVKVIRNDAFVLTAYLTDTIKKGRQIWPVET